MTLKTIYTSIFCFVFLVLLCACGSEKQSTQNHNPPSVDIAQPLKQVITEWDEYTGRFEAVDRVDVRSRVTGYLTEKKFKDGQIVQKGDVLFVIDPRPFEYELQRVQALYALAFKDYKRAVVLRKTQTISQEDYDRRLQELKVAEAALNDAKLDMEFTQVTASIDGKVSDGFVDIGNLVRENETVLTRIVSIDPIHFEFEASQTELLKYIRLDRAGKRPGSDTTPNPVFIKLQDEDRYKHAGRMDFVDNIVDPGTGTIHGRALVENKDAVIYPGLFGRARIIGSGEYEAVLLPEKAVNTDQSRKFVYTVNGENNAVRTYIEVGPVLDNGFIIIRSGLNGDERVVISGIQRIRTPDQPVTTDEKKLEWQEVETVPALSAAPPLSKIQNHSDSNPTNEMENDGTIVDEKPTVSVE